LQKLLLKFPGQLEIQNFIANRLWSLEKRDESTDVREKAYRQATGLIPPGFKGQISWGEVDTYVRRGIAANPYIAEGLTGRTQINAHLYWHASTRNGPEWAADYLSAPVCDCIRRAACILSVSTSPNLPQLLRTRHSRPKAARRSGFRDSGSPDFVKQVGVTVQNFEQFDQSQRWFCLAVLVPRKRIDPTTKDVRCLPLAKVQFLAHAGNEDRVNDGSVDLPVEGLHLAHDAIRLCHVGDRLIACRAKLPLYVRDSRGLAFVGVGDIAGIVDQFRCAANRTFHVQSSLKDTISAPALTRP